MRCWTRAFGMDRLQALAASLIRRPKLVWSRRRSVRLRVGSGWERFRQNRFAVVGLLLLSGVVIVAFLAPVLAPFPPLGLTGNRLMPPQARHLFGTDHLGRDIFSGVVFGTRTSFQVGFLAVLVSMMIGTVVGATAGFYGGRIDNLLMRLTEVFQVIPRFFLALVIVAIFGANIWRVIVVIGVLSWPEIARLLRAEFLTLRGRPFVLAARAYGANDFQLITGEVMPNALPPVIVAASLQVPSAILLEASLSFLGVGDPNVISWGKMLNDSQQFLREAWWTAIFPGMAIVLTTLGLTLTGEGLNDAFNPRLKEEA